MQTQATSNGRLLFRPCSLRQLPELASLSLEQWTQAWQQVELAIEQHPQWERANDSLILHFTRPSDASDFLQAQCLVGREIIGPPAALPAQLGLADSSLSTGWSHSLTLTRAMSWTSLYEQAAGARRELMIQGQELAPDWRLLLRLQHQIPEGRVKIAMELQFFCALGDKPILRHPFA